MNSKTAFEKIRDGLEQAIEHAEGKKLLTVHHVRVPEPPKPMTPVQIARLRREKIGVSQAVFAKLLNSSVKTIHAWEQGRTMPSGCALRFLEIVDQHPEVVSSLLEPA